MVTAVTVFSVLSFYLLVLLDAYILSYSKIMMTKTINSNAYVNRCTLFLEMIPFFRVTEVRSKILTPLETTGGNSFSLEGFEKMLFTIQNLSQGDLHSTGGI